jgi:hypothetical protein
MLAAVDLDARSEVRMARVLSKTFTCAGREGRGGKGGEGREGQRHLDWRMGLLAAAAAAMSASATHPYGDNSSPLRSNLGVETC